jgi:hypothetical protein
VAAHVGHSSNQNLRRIDRGPTARRARDLKPASVIEPRGRVRITVFELARLAA